MICNVDLTLMLPIVLNDRAVPLLVTEHNQDTGWRWYDHQLRDECNDNVSMLVPTSPGC